MGKSRTQLTTRERRFVEEYAADPNAVQAYFRAFGRLTSKGKPRSYHAAGTTAARLLKKAEICRELERANDAIAKRSRVDKERVLSEVAALAFADPADLYDADPGNGGLPAPKPWNLVPPHARKAIAAVKIKRKRLKADKDATEWEIEELEYKYHSKTDALEKLCKRLGFYADPDDGTKVTVPVELVTRLFALAGAQPGGVGPHPPGEPVDAEPGSAESGVPEPG